MENSAEPMKLSIHRDKKYINILWFDGAYSELTSDKNFDGLVHIQY